MTTSGGVPRDHTTVVRFRDVTQQPDYEATHPRNANTLPHVGPGFVAAHTGQELRIYITPEPLRSHLCGVERVWLVPDEEVIRLTGAPPPWGAVCVCEHQVEID